MIDPMVRKANVGTLMASVEHVNWKPMRPTAIRCLAFDSHEYPQGRISVVPHEGETDECIQLRFIEAIYQLKEHRSINHTILVFYDYGPVDAVQCARDDEQWNEWFAGHFEASHARTAKKRYEAIVAFAELPWPRGLPFR